MLQFITEVTDPMLDFVQDDPVRPELGREFRVSQNRFVAALVDGVPQAMICVSLQDQVPTTVDELVCHGLPTTAVFYTIWSYRAGSGTQLLFDTVAEIQKRWPSVTRFVTLSPKTALAHRFHTRNGAVTLRTNSQSVNYEYQV